MPLFQYRAITPEGRSIKGTIDADSLIQAKERLRQEKVLVTSLQAIGAKRQPIALNKTQLLGFTRELTQLLKAGLPLYESLCTIEEKQRRSKNHPLFIDLCDQLKGGAIFSSILARYPQTFDEVYLSMVRSAEHSGALSEAFDQLTLLISKQLKLKKQLTASLAYPAFLGGFCLLVIFGLFFFVIPSMEQLFEGRKLHPLTALIVSISHWLKQEGLVLGAFSLLAIISTIVLSKTEVFRRWSSQFLLSLPFLKNVILHAALVRFFRSMYMLLSGGVPLLEALHFAQKTVQNGWLEAQIVYMQKQMVEGKKLSTLWGSSSFIPPLVIRMCAIGEETGNMDFAMRNLAEIYEEELDKELLQITTFLQPAILLFLGAVVGLVVLSILLPLTDVSSFLSS